MTTNMIFILIATWLVSGFFTVGIAVGHFQGEYPDQARSGYKEDLGNALAMACFGPFATLCIFLLTGFCRYGLQWLPRKE